MVGGSAEKHDFVLGMGIKPTPEEKKRRAALFLRMFIQNHTPFGGNDHHQLTFTPGLRLILRGAGVIAATGLAISAEACGLETKLKLHTNNSKSANSWNKGKG